ncbi:unnamed protein product [Arctogadus glacialis]
MAPKTPKQTQKLLKFDATWSPSKQANEETSNVSEATLGTNVTTDSSEILTAIRALKDDFVARFDGLLNAMQGLKADVKAITVRVTGAEDRISTNQDDITSLLADNTAMKATIKELAVKVYDLENRSRRSNLRLVGIPEAFDQVKKDLAALSIPSLRYGVAHPATLLITHKGKRHTFDAVRTAEDFVKELRGQQHGECG